MSPREMLRRVGSASTVVCVRRDGNSWAAICADGRAEVCARELATLDLAGWELSPSVSYVRIARRRAA